MKIRIGCVPTFLSVCLFLGLATISGAQVFNPRDGSPDSAKVARGFSESVVYKVLFRFPMRGRL